jgi:hypothetical protein
LIAAYIDVGAGVEADGYNPIAKFVLQHGPTDGVRHFA